MKAVGNINKVPKNTERFIVARLVMNELWYWGSWDTKEAADRVAAQFDNGGCFRKDGGYKCRWTKRDILRTGRIFL